MVILWLATLGLMLGVWNVTHDVNVAFVLGIVFFIPMRFFHYALIERHDDD